MEKNIPHRLAHFINEKKYVPTGFRTLKKTQVATTVLQAITLCNRVFIQISNVFIISNRELTLQQKFYTFASELVVISRKDTFFRRFLLVGNGGLFFFFPR